MDMKSKWYDNGCPWRCIWGMRKVVAHSDSIRSTYLSIQPGRQKNCEGMGGASHRIVYSSSPSLLVSASAPLRSAFRLSARLSALFRSHPCHAMPSRPSLSYHPCHPIHQDRNTRFRLRLRLRLGTNATIINPIQPNSTQTRREKRR